MTAGQAPAQDPAQSHIGPGRELGLEFDARLLTPAEKRLLQLGLVVTGDYAGLLDGLWGQGSQRALEAFARRTDPGARVDGLARNGHVLVLTRRALDFLVTHGLRYRGGSPWGHRFLSPPGDFIPDPSTAFADIDLNTGEVYISIFPSGFADAFGLHNHLLDAISHRQPYTVRRKDRLVTATDVGSDPLYARSDLDPGSGAWFTTTVSVSAASDPHLLDVIAASITLDPSAEILTPGGYLDALLEVGRRVATTASPETGTPEAGATAAAIPPAPTEATGDPAPTSLGTAFFINNTDLVTARHVVEDCRQLTFIDGTPLDPVAIHPTLDLALLSSPRRSRDWIAVHRTGEARLGQRVVALGYPFYGRITTALNSTGGNVSAMVGVGDDTQLITITAAIHPGNSGGPLLALDGAVIGVVVATLDKIAVAEATGAIPENTNYAITGAELLAFLEAEDVSLPRKDPEPVNLDDGIPAGMQNAVVPVLCLARRGGG